MTTETAPAEKRRRLDRVTAACDLCKKRKVKYIQNRAHSEGNTLRPRSRDGTNQNQNQIGSSLSPTTSRDDHHEDTVVPLEGRILRDAQGKFIFIGDCAPLSFLQTVRYLISSEVDPDGFTVPAARDCIIEIARPTISSRPQYTSVNVHDVRHLVNKYLIATSGLVELFERDELVRELKAWASGQLQHSDDAAAAVFFLVLAIGAQEHDEGKADAWFEHARTALSKNMCNSMNVATVQGFALVAIYMLRAFQPNGAYLYFSLAARTAYAIGIHRTEVNASFGDSIRTMRDRIWKSLRVVDMLISTNLGRPPCTSDVDCTVKYSIMQMDNEVAANILDASVQIFMIIERVVVEVYSRKRISLRIADFVSRQLKGWASNWLQPLTETLNPPNRNDTALVALVGACSTLCTYYYGIMLLTRPFLIYEIYDYMGASMKGARTQGEHANKQKYADAALDAATSFVDTLQAVIRTGALPYRMPLIVSWLFTASLVLAVGTLGNSGSMFVENCESSIRCLEYFSSIDPHAGQYSRIVQSLLKLTATHVKKREMQLRMQRKQASSELFGLLASGTSPPSEDSTIDRFRHVAEPATSYSTEAPATTTAALDWTMYDADFFALPWPTEYDPGLQDFLQPGTHNSDGASVADIPLFPIYDRQADQGFLP
ncbi:uncharacterized protein N0V89_005205 [Didymosphaeria variabile]|uniref:Xylanolytic transcriptional activator regulatory domain-containing protein n=1 Tax=Didymosphaeria variabile TaxID=1932322 RepID=A0A9W8XMR5_9PLEO|nr:uncharacterized protein N0V89_005205 [Didymosphaeria variabile]KAJ4353475.1 hypothetical protein N0V89_005205 [Didymosphaeria variabile]